MRQEGLAEVDGGSVVGDELLVEDAEVDGGGLGEVKGALDTRVDEDEVDLGVFGENFGGKLGDLWN